MGKPINGSGVQQAAQTLTSNVWRLVAPANQNRMWISIQNNAGFAVYLYMGDTAPAAVDGSVSFYCLKAAVAGVPSDCVYTGDHEAIFRGPIWALCPGHGATVIVAEF